MASVYNITIEQGATFQLAVTLRDDLGALLDLTGYSGRMQIRQSVSSSTVLAELTSANGRVVITPASGLVELNLEASATSALPASSLVYDLELESSGGFVLRALQGAITIDPEVTR